jgi:hypothetical protein
MPALYGSSEQEEISRGCAILSVTLTPVVGADANLKFYRYTDETGDPQFIIRASGNSSNSADFPGGLGFSGGLTIVPTNAESYVVTYV